MCCTWLAGNAGPKNSPSGNHRTTLSGYIFATRACIDNRKKNSLNSNISPICPQNMVNFSPLVAAIVSLVSGTPANFKWFRVFASLLLNVAQREPTKLCTMFGRLLGWYTIYTFSGALAPQWNFAWCKVHFASKSCALLYWHHYCTALE